MQSSPPTRALPRRHSQSDSEYSLDLAALELDGDDTDTNIPQQKVERIFSEDVDGPSDFTQNMDMWMRGGTIKRKGTLGRNAGAQMQTMVEEKREEHERVLEEEDEQRDFLKVAQKGADAEDDHTGSHHTPENSPPKDHSQHQDQFSSEWHTDGEGSTPLPPAHKEFLQPTVEDYYTELSPARLAGSSYPGRGRPFTTTAHTGDGSTSGHAFSPTLSSVRSPILHRVSTSDSMRRELEDHSTVEIEVEFRELDKKCQQLEHLNQALSQALDEERRVRKSEKLSHESHSAEAARRERDLIEMKEAAHRHNDEFRREFGQLQEKLLNQQKMADLVRSGHQDNDQDHANELLRVNDMMEKQRMEHIKQVLALEQDLQSARRGRDDAEEMARIARQELEEERDVHQEERERLREDLYEGHEKESAALQLERQLQEARAEIAELKATNAEAAEQLKTASEELSAGKDAQDSELLRNGTERSRAIELAAELNRQLQGLKEQMKDDQIKHESEIQRIRSQHSQTGQSSTQELGIMHAELSAKQTELNEAILERDEARDSCKSAVAERNELHQKLVNLETLNSALDLRVTETIRKRENYWKDKVEEANKEREIMSKALLHQWGREEVGVESPQMFKYKYLSKNNDEERNKENRRPRKAEKRVGLK